MPDIQDPLFKNYSMGGLNLPSRIVMPPMTRVVAVIAWRRCWIQRLT